MIRHPIFVVAAAAFTADVRPVNDVQPLPNHPGMVSASRRAQEGMNPRGTSADCVIYGAEAGSKDVKKYVQK